jgi:hypothetical protein
VLASERNFSSGHSYSVEQFGLTEVGIFKELEDIFAEFGFEPPQRRDDPSPHDLGAAAEGSRVSLI